MRLTVCPNCAKCVTKAGNLAFAAKGVTSVTKEGELMNEIVVLGEGFDVNRLLKVIGKKVCYVKIVTLEDVKPPPPPAEKKPDNAAKDTPQQPCIPQYGPTVSYKHYLPCDYAVVYDSYGPSPASACSIM
ncbi:unnamed protein product [Cochlearia groenlandica]